MNSMLILDRQYLGELCRKWMVHELSIFGSALRDDFGPQSDIDLLVSFEPTAHWDLYDIMEMKFELEAHFGRSVDLIVKEAIRNPWRKREILNTCEVVYAA